MPLGMELGLSQGDFEGLSARLRFLTKTRCINPLLLLCVGWGPAVGAIKNVEFLPEALREAQGAGI